MKKFTQEDLANKFTELHGGTKKDALIDIKKYTSTIQALLEEGLFEYKEAKVSVHEFGIYTVKKTKERTQFSKLANGGKGGEVFVPSVPRVTFSQAKALKDSLDK